MRALLVVMLVLLMQSCGQIADTGAKMCDGVKKTLVPVNTSVITEDEEEVKQVQNLSDKGDETLLMYRMLRSI